MDLPILSLAIWVPILAGILVLFTGDDKNASTARWIALAGSLLAFAVTIPLYTQFNFTDGGFQFQEGLEPCPPCISQRLGVILVGLIMLAGAS